MRKFLEFLRSLFLKRNIDKISIPVVTIRYGGKLGGKVDKALWSETSFRFFNPEEFDSPDEPGSGINMDYNFMVWLDNLRGLVGLPFVITSGFRTPAHNRELLKQGYQASLDSPHMLGKAVDIFVPDNKFRYLLMKKALEQNCYRIGFGATFLHLDLDTRPTKGQGIIWRYE